MDDLSDFLFNSWWPFIIGGVCCAGLLPLGVAALIVGLIIYGKNKEPARRKSRTDFKDNEDG